MTEQNDRVGVPEQAQTPEAAPDKPVRRFNTHIPNLSPEEIELKILKRAERKRQKQREGQKRYRDINRAKRDEKSADYDSNVEISDDDAREILADPEQRGLKDEQDIKTCIAFAHAACRLLKIPFNKHLFTHGLQKTLEARSLGTPVSPLEIVDEWIVGYRSRRRELFALYDYVVSFREIK